MKIRIRNIISLVRWLQALPLSSEISKERTRFIKMAEPYINDLLMKRGEILNKYAEKDENGQLKMEEKDGVRRHIIPKDKEGQAEKEYADTLGTILEIPLDGNKSKLLSIKEILKTTSYEFSGWLADEYLAWDEAFESVVK